MREMLDRFAAWLTPKIRAWNDFIGDGQYWTLPFGNDGRGTRVYHHVILNFILVLGIIVIMDILFRG